MTWIYGSAIAVAVALFAGCDPVGVSETEEAPPPVELDDVSDTLEIAWCERIVEECRCGVGTPYQSMTDCRADVTQWIDRMTLGTFDAACMGSFVAQLDELGCEPLRDGLRACDLNNGPQSEGDPCMKNTRWSSECGIGLVCNASFECVREGSPVTAGEAESCSEHECEQGLECGADRRCLRVVGLGEECTGHVCEDGMECVLEPGTTDGRARCMALTANGQPCMGFRECASGYCPNGFCAPLPVVGESCEISGSCADDYECSFGRCVEPGPAVCDLDLPN
ncbi:MAG: hypothetical protein AAF799_03850 [Myxococcota bacterium]